MHRVLNPTLPSTHTRVLLASLVLSQHKCPMTACLLGDSCIMGPDVPKVLGGEQRLVVGADELTHQGPAGRMAPWSQSCRPGLGSMHSWRLVIQETATPSHHWSPRATLHPATPLPRTGAPSYSLWATLYNFYHLHRFFYSKKSNARKQCLRHPCTHIAR